MAPCPCEHGPDTPQVRERRTGILWAVVPVHGRPHGTRQGVPAMRLRSYHLTSLRFADLTCKRTTTVSSTPGVLVPVTARVSHQWTPAIRVPGVKEEEAPRPTLPFRGPRAGRGGMCRIINWCPFSLEHTLWGEGCGWGRGRRRPPLPLAPSAEPSPHPHR